MKTKNKKAFTLVELLTVISIIASLLSVLLPALSAARCRARSVVCKSNIRQLVLANTGYATENNNYYVPAAMDMYNSNGGLCRWHGKRITSNEPFDPLKGPLAKYLADGKVKQCPEKQVFTQTDKWSTSPEKGGGGYGYNITYIGSRCGQQGIGWKAGYQLTAKTTDVARTAETLMFADSAWTQNAANLIEYSFAEAPFAIYNGQQVSFNQPTIHFRHRGKANIAWVDGHISSHAMTKYEEAGAARYSKLFLGWFGSSLDNSLFDLK